MNNNVIIACDFESKEKLYSFLKPFEGLNPYIKEESLFFEEINGVQINLKLKNDIGIDKNSMTVNSLLSFDDYQQELISKTEQSHLNTLLEKLIILSKAGNTLANELHEQIKQKYQTLQEKKKRSQKKNNISNHHSNQSTNINQELTQHIHFLNLKSNLNIFVIFEWK